MPWLFESFLGEDLLNFFIALDELQELGNAVLRLTIGAPVVQVIPVGPRQLPFRRSCSHVQRLLREFGLHRLQAQDPRKASIISTRDTRRWLQLEPQTKSRHRPFSQGIWWHLGPAHSGACLLRQNSDSW